jgi:hypothetical protein
VATGSWVTILGSGGVYHTFRREAIERVSGPLNNEEPIMFSIEFKNGSCILVFARDLALPADCMNPLAVLKAIAEEWR